MEPAGYIYDNSWNNWCIPIKGEGNGKQSSEMAKNIQIAKPNSECISNWDQNSGGLQFMGASIIKMTIYHVVIQSIVLNPTIIIMIKA